MYCRMIRGAYIRANGEMACYCGPGEDVILGQLPVDGSDFDFVKDYYRNRAHLNVGRKMHEGVLPYPGVCLKCIYLDPLGSPGPEASDEIEWIHIEATSICNLNCRFCIPKENRLSYRVKPHYFPYELYTKMVDDIVANNMTVKWMYFSGQGEPGLHPRIWDMVQYAKDRLDTNFLVNTNGNIKYDDLIVDSGLDKIKVAVDGADQETYVAYRRDGKLSKAVDLTRRIHARKQELGVETPKIIWQYIIFEHNDTDEDIIAIQELAKECGVDEMWIKTTFSANYSRRSLDSIPRVFDNIIPMDLIAMVETNNNELDTKQAELEKLAAEGRWEELVPKGVETAKGIFRNFILGIERKQFYNDFGVSDDMALMEALADSQDLEFLPQIVRITPVFRLLAEAYRQTGRAEAARYYDKFSDKLEQSELGRRMAV